MGVVNNLLGKSPEKLSIIVDIVGNLCIKKYTLSIGEGSLETE